MARYIGKGSAIGVQTVASPETYVDFAQVMEFGGFSFTTDEAEVTTIVDDYRQFKQTVKDGGECPITVVFDPNLTNHIGDANSLNSLFQSGEDAVFRVTIPSSPVWYLKFSGYIKGFDMDVFNNSTALTATYTVRVQGSPTLEAA